MANCLTHMHISEVVYAGRAVKRRRPEPLVAETHSLPNAHYGCAKRGTIITSRHEFIIITGEMILCWRGRHLLKIYIINWQAIHAFWKIWSPRHHERMRSNILRRGAFRRMPSLYYWVMRIELRFMLRQAIDLYSKVPQASSLYVCAWPMNAYYNVHAISL